MAIVHADNFSIYGTTYALMLNGIYAQVVTTTPSGQQPLRNDPDGVSGGKVFIPGYGAGSGFARFVLPTLDNTVGACFRIWMSSLPTKTTGAGRAAPSFWFQDAAIGTLFRLYVTETGRIRVEGIGAQSYETVNPVLTANGWYHIEFKAFMDATVGSLEVRVEGQTVLLQENINTGAFPAYQVSIGTEASGAGINAFAYFKDLVVWNGAGTQNNDFLGSVIVHNLTPTSDIALNWTPSTGTDGYSILDNIPPNDGQYIFAEDSPLPDGYVATLSDLPPEVTSIKALITYVRAAKSDGGDGSLQTGLISDPDGTPATALGLDRPITVAQTYWRDIFEVDPATTAPWLPDAVNDVQLQIDRTT
jgi:hypothetical protein